MQRAGGKDIEKPFPPALIVPTGCLLYPLLLRVAFDLRGDTECGRDCDGDP